MTPQMELKIVAYLERIAVALEKIAENGVQVRNEVNELPDGTYEELPLRVMS